MYLSKITTSTLALATSALLAFGCGGKKDDDKKAGGPTPGTPGEPDKPGKPGPGGGDNTDLNQLVTDLAAKIGVEPGAVEPEADEGAEAALTARTGTVQVRRAGEDEFADAPAGDVELHGGDQLRTAAESTATLVLADESTVELAEETAIAIGDPAATADPSQSVAVLAGVARFTVAPRGAGEGPFMVHTPGGIVTAKGTVIAVGVAVTGVARVGVEEGEVEVAGRADFSAPVVVAAGNSTTLTMVGAVEPAVAFTSDDWGEWRDTAEASAEPAALVEAQTVQLAELDAQLEAAYPELEALSTTVDAEAAVAVEAETAADPVAYEAVAEPLGADVEATYLASLRLQNLTFAALSSAYVTAEINARFPEQTEVVVVKARPRLVGALLWNKKYRVVVHHHIRPLRPVYYVHHPVGRQRAVVVKHTVPAFYAKVVLKPLDPVRVRSKFKVVVYTPPVIVKVKPGKKVWVTAPARGWQAKVKVKPFKARATAGWYVRAKAPKAKVFVGVKAKARPPRVFVNARPAAVGKVNLKFGTAAGVKVKAGAGGTIKVKTPGTNVKIDAPGTDVKIKTGADAKATIKAGPGGGVMVKVKEKGEQAKGVVVGPGGGVVVKGKAGAKVVVPPVGGGIKVKGGVKGEAKGGIKIGPKKPN
jgi:hypothetical protein